MGLTIHSAQTFKTSPPHYRFSFWRGDYKYINIIGVKIINHFHLRPNSRSTLFTSLSGWEPEFSQLDGELQRLIHTDKWALHSYRPPRDVLTNLSRAERRALKELVQNPNIIIKPEDKGSKIVILDRQQYLLEANRQSHIVSNPKHKNRLGLLPKIHHNQTKKLVIRSNSTTSPSVLPTTQNS